MFIIDTLDRKHQAETLKVTETNTEFHVKILKLIVYSLQLINASSNTYRDTGKLRIN